MSEDEKPYRVKAVLKTGTVEDEYFELCRDAESCAEVKEKSGSYATVVLEERQGGIWKLVSALTAEGPA